MDYKLNNIRSESNFSDMNHIIQSILNQDDLDTILTKPDLSEILQQILDYRIELIASNKALRKDFPVESLYQAATQESPHVAYILLRFALFTQESDQELQKLISHINSAYAEEDLSKLLNLLIIAFDVCDFNKCPQVLKLVNISNLENLVTDAIKSCNKNVRDIAILELLPKYLTHLCNDSQSLEKFYNCVLETADLTILCTFLNHIFKYAGIEYCFFLRNEQFWLFLENIISNKDPFSQKLGSFILAKAINFIYTKYNIISSGTPFIISEKRKITLEMKDAWVIYFHLLDISREKQLHLIEPCLGMLEQIRILPLVWQTCIYKVFLVHDQNLVVYFTAEKVFCDTYNKQILTCALQAVNKYDCCSTFKKVFDALKCFCSKLSSTEFEELLQEFLHISWNPIAMWYFCKNVFSNDSFKIPLKLLLSVLKKIESLPHVYIRTNCIRLVLKGFAIDKQISFKEIMTVFQFLYKYDKEEFKNYIKSHKHIFDKYNSDFVIFIDTWIEINESSDQIEALLSIIYHANLETVITYVKQNIHSFYDELKDIVYLHLFETFSDQEIENYIRVRQIIRERQINPNLETFYMLLKKLVSRGYPERLPNVVVSTLTHDHSKTAYQTLSSIISNKELFSENHLESLLVKYIPPTDNINGVVCNNFIDLYFDLFLTEKVENVSDRLQEIIEIMTDFFHSKDETVTLKIFEKLQIILEYQNDYYEIILNFLDTCSNQIIKLTAKPIFKEVVKHFIIAIYNPEHLDESHYRKDVLKITENLVACLKQNDYFLYMLTNHYKTLLMKHLSSFEDFIPLITEIIFYGMTTNKGERTEYFICQEIAECNRAYRECPNVLKMQIRLSALECLIAMGKENLADICVSVLINKYKQFYRKRYFPDSQVHFQQLRIMQVLLILQPYIDKTRSDLRNFLMDSFCEEIHQPCVRQLMQWLLILLLKDNTLWALDLITEKMNTADRTQPSTIVAFIPVIYHSALQSQGNFWSEIIEAFLLWTMGAHFKLRVYSQVAILKLYEQAQLKDYRNIIRKYKHLYVAIRKIIDSSQEQFHEVLKRDSEFFDLFDPYEDYSIETILTDIPRMNAVNHSEWENVCKYRFTCAHILVFNQRRALSDHISKNYSLSDKSKSFLDQESSSVTSRNIQKKITPWKAFLEDDTTSLNVNEFILVANLIEKPTNLGGLSRTCEVFGVKQFVVNNKSVIKNSEFKSLSMSSENWMEYIEVKTEESISFIKKIKSSGYTVIGAEQTSESILLSKYSFPKKCALILGNEKEGIPPDILPFLDACVEIPQFGVVRSLNVHVAGALFMWEYTKQNLT